MTKLSRRNIVASDRKHCGQRLHSDGTIGHCDREDEIQAKSISSGLL